MNFTTLMAAASVNNGLMARLPLTAQSSGGQQGGDPPAANPPRSPRHYTAADIPDAFRVAAAGIINAHGLRLIRQFEGPPRTKARLCEGGAYELGAGVTFHFDGTRVQEGETCDDAYGEAMFVNALKIFVRAVDLYVTVPVDDNQRAALTAFAYNCGIEALKGSSLLKRVNERRFDDAAVAFGMWIYATKNGHTQALRGLLRRRYAEACLFMSLDWEEATEDDAIALQRRKPASLPGKDEVVSKTLFHQVFAVARLHPLPPEPIVTIITDKPPEFAEPLKDELILADKLPPPSPELATSEVAVRETVETSQPLPSPPASNSNPSSAGGSTFVADSAPAKTDVASAREEVGGPLPPVAPASVGTKVVTPMEKPNAPAEPDAQPAKKKDTMGTIAKDAGLDRSSVEKAITAWLIWLGNSLRSLGANGMKFFGLSGSSLSVIADQLQQPFVQIMVATAFFVCLTGGIWFVGVITEKGALKVKVKAERAEAAT